MKDGVITTIAGPVVKATKMSGSKMYDVVKVGEDQLIGEIIELEEDEATIQVYEETSGVRPGERVFKTGRPLSVELGPGLITQIYDGIQRPLPVIAEKTGDFITRGIDIPPLDHDKKWRFTPTVSAGDEVTGGSIIGTVPETVIKQKGDEETVIEHRVMVPHGTAGTLEWVAEAGEYTIEEPVARLATNDKNETKELTMLQYWPVRQGRPFAKKKDPNLPLLTGQRILDTFFPMSKGGTAAIPGGFGTGKTVTQHQLAKWCDAEVIVYVGCGERATK